MTPAKCHYRIIQNRAGILNTIIIVSVLLLLTGSLII